MLFSIIYSVDVPNDVKIERYEPSELFELTEGNEWYGYNYLGGEWEDGHHGKWIALLTKEQFIKFIQCHALWMEDVETLGSLGAPGCGTWAPAFSFTNDQDYAILSAYITPIPEVSEKVWDTRDWKRIRKAMLSCFGCFGVYA